jgi:hypothetical protein
MSTRAHAKAPSRPTAPRTIKAAIPIKAMTVSAKLKIANAAALKAGLSQLFRTATPLMTWGFNAVNDASIGKLKAGPGLGTVDFETKRVEMLPVDAQIFPRPLTLNVFVPKGHFYVVDVCCTPSKAANFFATSNRTSTGANYTTQYGMTLDTLTHHFVFVLQAHGTADGSKNAYRIEVGADQPWAFEKIELTKVG